MNSNLFSGKCPVVKCPRVEYAQITSVQVASLVYIEPYCITLRLNEKYYHRLIFHMLDIACYFL